MRLTEGGGFEILERMFPFFRRHTTFSALAIVVLGGVFYLGWHFGTQQAQIVTVPADMSGDKKPEAVDLSTFWQAWQLLDERFVGSTTPKSQEKVWGAIAGLTASYNDPYTVFLPPEEAKTFEENVSGNFEGVGMEIGIREDILTVIAPIKGSPAAKAGILAGDRILKINATSTQGLSVDKAVKLIRGPRGTSVTFTVLRMGAQTPVEISVVRDVIDIPTVETEKRPDGVFVIHLFNFGATSPGLFRNALREFAYSGVESERLIIDLRNNPGGYLEAAVDMASWFLPVGKTIVAEDFGNSQSKHFYRSKGYNPFNDKLKVVILVNGGSASASEIFAGALHDHGLATIVGEKTFGKGSVQELFPLPMNSSLKITIARWLTPNGISISQGGIKPDVEVKNDPKDTAKKIDTQLEKAAQILLKK